MAKTRKSSDPQTRFVTFTDADGQEVIVNPALVQFVSPAGHEARLVFSPDNTLHVRLSVQQVLHALECGSEPPKRRRTSPTCAVWDWKGGVNLSRRV